MRTRTKYSKKMVIKNRLGFHVRPVQRFAELAGIFRSSIEVEIDGQRVSGKSMLGLVSLGGRCGSVMRITAMGEDARQAMGVLSYLVDQNFFVEDDLDKEKYPDRHITRLVTFASCFDSNVWVVCRGKKINVRDNEGLLSLGLRPTSRVEFLAEGLDSMQARQVLDTLASYQFYVEDEMGARARQKAD